MNKWILCDNDLSNKHIFISCCVAYVKFNLYMFAYFLNRVDFFVELSFLMQSISKVPHLIHCFPSEVSQVCKNCQTYDQLLIHQVWTAKNAFLLSLYKEFSRMQDIVIPQMIAFGKTPCFGISSIL